MPRFDFSPPPFARSPVVPHAKPRKPRKAKFNTLTTRGRIAKAFHESQQESPTPEGTSDAVEMSDPPKHKSKTKSKSDAAAPTEPAGKPRQASSAKSNSTKPAPPTKSKASSKKAWRVTLGRPEDMEAERNAEDAERMKKARAKRGPKTTRAKVREAKVKEGRVAKTKAKAKADSGNVPDGKLENGKAGKARQKVQDTGGMNLMDIMRDMQLIGSTKRTQTVPDASEGRRNPAGHKSQCEELYNLSEEQRLQQSVLSRPTARSLWIKRQMLKDLSILPTLRRAGMTAETSDTESINDGGNAGSNINTGSRKCYLLALPAEMRNVIVGLVVTETQSFLDPLTRTGAEQPDLAMTCRQLREEVLPVYYGCNVFLIGVPCSLDLAFDSCEDPRALKMRHKLQQWLNMLQQGGRIESVAH